MKPSIFLNPKVIHSDFDWTILGLFFKILLNSLTIVILYSGHQIFSLRPWLSIVRNFCSLACFECSTSSYLFTCFKHFNGWTNLTSKIVWGNVGGEHSFGETLGFGAECKVRILGIKLFSSLRRKLSLSFGRHWPGTFRVCKILDCFYVVMFLSINTIFSHYDSISRYHAPYVVSWNCFILVSRRGSCI